LDRNWTSFFCSLHAIIIYLAKFNDLHSQKLLLKYRIFHQHAFFSLIDVNTLSISLKATFSVEPACLKPNCSGTNMLLVCISWLNLLHINFSSTLKEPLIDKWVCSLSC
jgi:hypothetical protein